MKKKLLLSTSLLLTTVYFSHAAFVTPSVEQAQEKEIKAFTDAAYTNKKAKVEELLKAGIDINSKGPGGQTALQRAASQGHVEMVTFLLQNGANPNTADRVANVTPLIAAVMSYPSRPNLPGIENMVKTLIAHGAQIDAQNKSGQTALMIAVASQLYPIVQILLEGGANIWLKNSFGDGPLDFINVKTIQDLEQRALNAIKEKETTTEKERVEALEKEIALVRQQIDNITRIRALFATKENIIKEFLDAAATNNKEKVETLLSAGTLITTRDAQGRTALHQAASQGHVEAVALLLQNGANLESKDALGQTPLHVAASNGQVPMVQFLLQQGADASSLDKENNTPLITAILAYPKHKNLSAVYAIVQTLLNQNVDINAQNKSGQTALILASVHSLHAVAQMLLETGADVDLEDNLQRKAIDWAKNQIMDLLLKTDKKTQSERAAIYKKEVEIKKAKQLETQEARRKEELRKQQEEAERRKQEELQRQREEEARQQAELRRQQEEEARRQEELRKQQEEEAQRKQEEAQRLKQQEDEARRKEELRKQQEEAERRRQEELQRQQEEEQRLPNALSALTQGLIQLRTQIETGQPKVKIEFGVPGIEKHQ